MDAGETNAYIGRYRCISYLGSGGMADVFKCELQGIGGFGKLCVVKRMKNELAHDEEHVAMFLDEARLVARIQHPNVVQVFEVDAVDNIPFIAMELVRGPTLSQLTRAARKRSDIRPELLVRVIADVALGLSAAHVAVDDNGAPLNIVHRDVSPQNIMIGLGGTAKILDFGIAKAEGKLGKTATGLLKGKVAYMSPEQINIKDVDARADVYSLGVCLYQAIVGHLPFRGTNDFEVLRARMGGDFTPASVVRPDLPVALTSLIDRALAEDPADRFDSALEFHEELETWLLDEVAADRRALSMWLSELFPDIDALVVGRPIASMGMVSTVPSTQTMTPTSQPSASRLSSTGGMSPGSTPSPGLAVTTGTSSGTSSPGMAPLSLVAPEPTRETQQMANASPRRFSPMTFVVGGVAALAAGLGVFAVMQRSPSTPVVAVAPVVPVAPVVVPPPPPPVVPVVPVEPVAPPVEPVPVVEDDVDVGSLDDVVAPAAAAAKPKPKPWAKAPASSASSSPSSPSPTANPPPTPPPPPPPVIEPAVTSAPSAVSAVPAEPVAPSSAPAVSPEPKPADVAVAPEAPVLPKQKRVLQVKELVAACAEIEAELERHGHLPAARVRNVTAPLARALASKLVDGDVVELPMTSIYWFVARRLTSAGQSGPLPSRGAVATALVDAYQSNSLGR